MGPTRSFFPPFFARTAAADTRLFRKGARTLPRAPPWKERRPRSSRRTVAYAARRARRRNWSCRADARAQPRTRTDGASRPGFPPPKASGARVTGARCAGRRGGESTTSPPSRPRRYRRRRSPCGAPRLCCTQRTPGLPRERRARWTITSSRPWARTSTDRG